MNAKKALNSFNKKQREQLRTRHYRSYFIIGNLNIITT